MNLFVSYSYKEGFGNTIFDDRPAPNTLEEIRDIESVCADNVGISKVSLISWHELYPEPDVDIKKTDDPDYKFAVQELKDSREIILQRASEFSIQNTPYNDIIDENKLTDFVMSEIAEFCGISLEGEDEHT